MTKKIIGIAGNQLLQAAEVFHGNQVTYTPQGFVSRRWRSSRFANWPQRISRYVYTTN